ncbi:PAAR domain-containing protein [Xanthomonas oryzae]|uniref:PAAR domain-containing protein n=1 Tax=Xanthomonas oryzae TaxID=347 RepID=UPI001FD6A574|nr:PAAR domain-containing protein [Xanthomonas oryzae]
MDGKPVARIGDKVVCKVHGQTEIASGDATVMIDGKPVARHGDKTPAGVHLSPLRERLASDDDAR